MKERWAAATADLLQQFKNNLGGLNPEQALADLKIWVGYSPSHPQIQEVTSVLRELLETHGAIVLPKSKPQGAFDDTLVLEQLKSVDHIAMLAVTPGVSVEALELCNVSKPESDKMFVYMPSEYRDGYICDLLQRRHDSSRIRFFPISTLLEPAFCCKLFWDALEAASMKDRKRKMEPVRTPRIGIITALSKEFRAVEAILGDATPAVSRTANGYRNLVHGTIAAHGGGLHHVVLALAGKGNNKAAIRATQLLQEYGTVEEIFMVGIAAGVPNPKKPQEDVRLGDVVVADEFGVIQYDMIKDKTGKRQYAFPPRPPSPDWVNLLNTRIDLMNSAPTYWRYLDEILSKLSVIRPRKDHLNDSPWQDLSRIIKRPRDKERSAGRPKLHMGPIGSANTVLKRAAFRDALQDKFHILAIEMEASGIADATWEHGKGYMVVRGICDYANDGKNDTWQNYAACTAAAFSRQLIEEMPLRTIHKDPG
ncbi:5'-methylthioadenosine/S-adenosylhomocysteine nucleosidase [Bradyrhizobium ontarionense]|uniref:5'-methylthioadenosine/S-adenosylhomocysteine nucleosidase n=1 Tax=Bradyrhizobium ontarionense TaxID=2898149 RepID=A0ABY3R6M2_9BRAD|nr:5'-methylthioadenosine/S-adenosylhomocysteine nucleosidase [Bradyrhizobium sp. A19]UFZ02971.1 5'-methylthioadenosine/S-adenosylhomocysteine nucleosidase [Bradyrhizobium sp. A19]